MRLKFPRFDPSAFSRLTFKPPEQQHLSKLVRELESSQSTLPPPERERIEKIIARFREHFDEDLSTLKDRSYRENFGRFATASVTEGSPF